MKRDKYAHVCKREGPSCRERDSCWPSMYFAGLVCVRNCCCFTHTRRM